MQINALVELFGVSCCTSRKLVCKMTHWLSPQSNFIHLSVLYLKHRSMFRHIHLSSSFFLPLEESYGNNFIQPNQTNKTPVFINTWCTFLRSYKGVYIHTFGYCCFATDVLEQERAKDTRQGQNIQHITSQYESHAYRHTQHHTTTK